jgi:two-component system, cell cycle response regulator
MSRILVIDDDRLQFRLVQEYVRAFRGGVFEVVWAEAYDKGLAELLTGGYAACILDYRLGDRDGLALLREAQGRGCRTPIVFLTAESTGNVDLEALEAGAVDYLVKGEINARSLERSLRYALKLGETLEALRRLATRDELTGLSNRMEYERVMAEEETRAVRFGQPLSLVIVDIDLFKAINDTHGHSVGDTVLREIASRLSASIRNVDRAARIGGEEFALILPQTSARAAAEVATRALETVRSAPIRVRSDIRLRVTASAGVAALPSDAATAQELFEAADRALYAAKQAGCDRLAAAPGKAP